MSPVPYVSLENCNKCANECSSNDTTLNTALDLSVRTVAARQVPAVEDKRYIFGLFRFQNSTEALVAYELSKRCNQIQILNYFLTVDTIVGWYIDRIQQSSFNMAVKKNRKRRPYLKKIRERETRKSNTTLLNRLKDNLHKDLPNVNFGITKNVLLAIPAVPRSESTVAGNLQDNRSNLFNVPNDEQIVNVIERLLHDD